MGTRKDYIGLAIIAIAFCVLMVGGLWLVSPELHSVHAQASHGFITYADITGSGSAAQVDSTAGHACRWIQIVTPSTNSTTLTRWGDSNITSSRGGTIAAGGGQFLPPIPSVGGNEQFYDITKLYVLAASMDKVTVVCGQ